jgi:hypothetical protein
MIPSNEKSIAPMRLLLPGFVAVSHLEVKLPVSGEYSLKPVSVWGVIWLLIAFMYFAAGVIVGIVAFKVFTYCSRSVTVLTDKSSIRSLHQNRKRRLRTFFLLLDLAVLWYLHQYRVS